MPKSPLSSARKRLKPVENRSLMAGFFTKKSYYGYMTTFIRTVKTASGAIAVQIGTKHKGFALTSSMQVQLTTKLISESFVPWLARKCMRGSYPWIFLKQKGTEFTLSVRIQGCCGNCWNGFTMSWRSTQQVIRCLCSLSLPD